MMKTTRVNIEMVILGKLEKDVSKDLLMNQRITRNLLDAKALIGFKTKVGSLELKNHRYRTALNMSDINHASQIQYACYSYKAFKLLKTFTTKSDLLPRLIFNNNIFTNPKEQLATWTSQ
ncbi:unnamed protein product [Gordionus sp. m RMFG-2023]